jgi:hypothetical protein
MKGVEVPLRPDVQLNTLASDSRVLVLEGGHALIVAGDHVTI